MSTDKIEYTGTVDELGTLKIINRRQFDESLKSFAGKEVEIIVQRKKSRRSDPQNKYYWAVVVTECQQGFRELGNDWSKEQVHDFLKTNYNYREVVNESTGEVLRYPLSTARLTKSEFSEMIEKIIRFAAEYLNVQITPAIK